MKKEKIIETVMNEIMNNFPEFKGLKLNEENIGSSKAVAKKLGLEQIKDSTKIYAFTVIKREPFRDILRIVIDENGKFVKISRSK